MKNKTWCEFYLKDLLTNNLSELLPGYEDNKGTNILFSLSQNIAGFKTE